MSVNARRSVLATLVVLCTLIGALLVASAPALAASLEAPTTEPAELVQNTTAEVRGIPYPHTLPESGTTYIPGFEYNEGSSCTGGTTLGTTQGELEDKTVGDVIRESIRGLRPGTKYTFCMFVTNEGTKEVVLGGPQSFTTTSAMRFGIGENIGTEHPSGSGETHDPSGVAVNQATGDVYVADLANLRMDVFDAAGRFVMAWGWSVNAASPADELQTCTTACQTGLSVQDGAPGAFLGGDATGVAVDNELGSSSYGDVYVVQVGDYRVEKFSSSGQFLSMFGGDVNETTGGDVCVAGEKCQRGTQGTADGQFEWALGAAGYVAVGPEGRVYVGDRARVQVFEESGVWRENISLAGLSASDQATALAVNSSGDIFVSDGNDNNEQGVPGVREFEPDGTEMATQFDAGSTTIEGLALNGSGELFVGDSAGGFHVLMYGPTGTRLASFGANTVIANSGAMAFSEALGELYVPNSVEYSDQYDVYNITALPTPLAGAPVIEEAGVHAVPGRRGVASLDAAFDPGDYATKYRFEYVSETDFQANGFADATSTAEGTAGAVFEEQPVSANLTGLVPGETYRYRFVASNTKGTVASPDESFEEVPPALVNGPWVVDVSSTSATIDFGVDPMGASTEYRLEYGTSISYGQSVSGSAGEGEGFLPLSLHRQELLPGTVYHYRIVVENEVGAARGADGTFTTQPAAARQLTLPDGRAWELVSPPNKKGALIEKPGQDNLIQAAADGSAISYVTSSPLGENPLGRNSISDQTLSVRGPNGWSSEALTIPTRLLENETATINGESSGMPFPLFSADLSSAVVEPAPNSTPPLSSEASERTLYLRDDASGSYLPLVTPANVPAGTKFGGEDSPKGEIGTEIVHFLGATPDLSHIVLRSPYQLTTAPIAGKYEGEHAFSGPEELYEWSAGRLALVNVLPDGEPSHAPALLGAESEGGNGGGDERGGGSSNGISSDGQRIVWWLPHGKEEGLYVRDMAEEKTVQVGKADALFQTMSSDGSEIFFSEGGELYAFDVETATQTPLTANHGAGEVTAGVEHAVLGTSRDGSYVYFVATGVLAAGGIGGAPNLYVSHDAGGVWSTAYVATLSPEDEKDWFGQGGLGTEGSGGVPAIGLAKVTSEVSPNGQYVTFMSEKPLTGYDNRDAISGQSDEEVYLYHANVSGSGALQAGRLVCASCDPTGARPLGVFDNFSGGENSGTARPLVNENGTWGGNGGSAGGSQKPHWLAGSLPGASEADNRDVYYPRYLSDEGRLFFNSPDGLVAQATNGLEDVYEYEPPGVGSCTTSEPGYSERSDGCVNLVSSGTSSGESVFYDTSVNGDDVFFITSAKLVAADYDTSYDVYDAHVCSSEAPCTPEAVSPPECTTEASCRPAPAPQPEIFGPAPSATFSGVGNVGNEATSAKPKAKTKVKKKKARKKKKKGKGKKASKSKAKTSGSPKAGNDRRAK